MDFKWLKTILETKRIDERSNGPFNIKISCPMHVFYKREENMGPRKKLAK